MDTMTDLDITIKSEIPDVNDRKDPTSFLPEEPMSYEIKVKKKKKKKKKQEDDPFKDIHENVLVTERVIMPDVEEDILDPGLDPEVTIKAENIEVELDFNDFTSNDDYVQQNEDSQEPIVKLETDNKEAVLLTFESIVNDKVLEKMAEQTEQIAKQTEQMAEQGVNTTTVPVGHICKVCHLIFKNLKTLKMHQKRRHKIFRRNCKHVCDDCGMAYDQKSSLAAHMKRKHGPDANKYNDNIERTCEECSLVFKGTNRLRLHMQRKHGAFKSAFKHECEDCGMAYENIRSLLVHRRRKHFGYKAEVLDQWIQCPFCPKMFDKRETYARHMQRKHHSNGEPKVAQGVEDLKNHTNEAGEIFCKQCPCVFSSVTYLKVHMRRKHNILQEDFKLKCRVCNLSYNRKESLKRHVMRKHDSGAYCDSCRKQFNTREDYLNHSHVKSVNECNICGLIFATLGGLGKHLRCIHKIDQPKVAFCNICNEGFHDKRLLKPHLLRVHYRVSYTCKNCDKVFKNKESYHRHITVKHSETAIPKKPIHKCNECPESFVDELELCKHVNIVHSEVDRKPDILDIKLEDFGNPYRCTKCPETFPAWEPLRSHYAKNHYKVVSVMCQKCGEEVKGEVELQKHIKQVHSEDLTCRFCDFKTKQKVTMTKHMLRHKNATTLQCDYLNCKYKTFYTSAMEKHKSKHNEQGVKYQCTQCSFQTMNKYILRYHEENHATGKKRYNCEECEYATNLPANLIQHKYKHATEKRFKCDLCSFATKYNTSLRFHVKKKHCDLPS
ncbi:hypothetical protein O0L34_g10284 [Tuta absoluta]|nr:hypothetical protein O0L34_g10284 [Tuta absoluta]